MKKATFKELLEKTHRSVSSLALEDPALRMRYNELRPVWSELCWKIYRAMKCTSFIEYISYTSAATQAAVSITIEELLNTTDKRKRRTLINREVLALCGVEATEQEVESMVLVSELNEIIGNILMRG